MSARLVEPPIDDPPFIFLQVVSQPVHLGVDVRLDLELQSIGKGFRTLAIGR